MTLPAILIFIGVILSAIGVFWTSRIQEREKIQSAQEKVKFEHELRMRGDEQIKAQNELLQKSQEIADLTRRLAEKSDKIAELNERIAGSVTGGESYCYVMPLLDQSKDTIEFMVFQRGNYPILNVKVWINDVAAFEEFPFTEKPRDQMSRDDWEELMKRRDLKEEYDVLKRKTSLFIDVGAIVPGTVTTIGVRPLSARPHYFIRIFALNGIVEQEIVAKKTEGDWGFSSRATQTLLGSRPKVVWENINPKIPLTILRNP
jgi:hypothetical protein